MKKLTRKNYLVITIGIVLLFGWFWNERFGIAPRYQHGRTIEQALDFWYKRGSSNTGLSKVLYTEDIGKGEKLVFYQSNTNDLWSGLVKRKWNNEWMVIEHGGGIPLSMQNGISDNKEDILTWQWHNMKEFGLTFPELLTVRMLAKSL